MNPYIVRTLHEIEDGEGNGVVHWYCSDVCRDREQIDYGDVNRIDIPLDECPEGSICETCEIVLSHE